MISVDALTQEEVKNTSFSTREEVKNKSTNRKRNLKEFLLERWGRKCAYCGQSDRLLVIEHIIPKSRGGSSAISNLTISCYDCNIAKGNKTASEFGFPKVEEKALLIGRSTKITARDGGTLNLYVLQLLRSGKNPAQICKILCILKQTLQYHLDQLKREGVIRKIGYGTWEVSKDKVYVPEVKGSRLRVAIVNPQTHLEFFQQDAVRAHAFMFTLKISKDLRNWDNENREFFLKKNNINFTDLTTFGGGQRIIFKGRKIWLTNKSVIIYEKSSYLAETAANAKSHAIYNFISLIKSLERLLHADFTERAGRQYSFKVSRQHYALIKNALAKQYDAEGKKLNVYSDKGLWFVIDNSFNLHEAETVHPETADTDSVKVQNFFNSLKEQPLTTGFILEVMHGIQENQMVFAQNMSSHIKVIKDLGNGVNELASILDELKQGHGQLSKGQRTLEEIEEKK